MSRAWYEFALAPSAGGTGTLVAAAGDHLGEALAEVVKAHPRRKVVAARRAATSPLGDSVGRGKGIREVDAALALPAGWFHWPAGVLPDLSALPAQAAAPGYVVHREPDLLVVEAQVDAEALVDVFLGLIERQPSADNVELRLMHHFEGVGQTEVWLSPRIGGKRVLRFLDAHDRELLGNGLVEVAVYVRAEQSTVRLTEHKTVQWLSREPSSEGRITKALAGLGVRPVAALTSVSAGPHFHYRPHPSRDRAALARYLEKQRMKLVDRLDESGQSLGTVGARPAT